MKKIKKYDKCQKEPSPIVLELKKENRPQLFFLILICLIIYGYSIYIGSPIKNNTNPINLIVLLIFAIYMLINIIKKEKYKIIKSKIDIFIIILVFSAYIALIFQNYANLEGTIEYIIKYATILSLYIMIRDIVKKDKKYIQYIINTIMISAISIFIIGLDDLTFQFSERLIEITKNPIFQNKDKRFWGLFGYANTTATLMLAISIIAIGEYLKSKSKKIQIFYNLIIFISITAIIMSYSRAVWILTVVAYFAYILISKQEKAEIIEILLRTGIISIIYSLVAIKLINSNNFLYVWLLLILCIGIVAISYKLSEKVTKIIAKIKIKYYIICLILLIMIALGIWNIGLKMTAPLEMFNSVYTKKEPTQDITDVQPNTKYKYEFEINAKTAYSAEDIYKIQVCERNKYDDILVTHEIKFGTFNGTKNIEFTSTEYTHKILIRYLTENNVAQKGITINSLKINDEEIPVNYKFLPIRIVDKVKDIKLNTISVTGRADYMKVACKLISKHGILGIGADGWKDRQTEEQDYVDFANEVHSYILEVFCEFGLVGFVSALLIGIEIIKKVTKQCKNKENNITQTSILVAIMTIILHSCIDFDLSFMYSLVLLFTLIAIAENEEKDYKYLDTIMKIFVSILIAVAIYFDGKILIYEYEKNEANPYSVDYIYDKLESDNQFEENIDEIVKRRKYISHVDMFIEIIRNYELTENQYIKLYDIISKEKQISKNDVYIKLDKIDFYFMILEKNIQNEKIKEEILLEIEDVRELLNDPEKCRLSLEEIEYCKNILKQKENEV